MLNLEQQTGSEEPEIRLLKEWLPRIGGEHRAYIKGATRALLFVQEEAGGVFTTVESRRCCEGLNIKNNL